MVIDDELYILRISINAGFYYLHTEKLKTDGNGCGSKWLLIEILIHNLECTNAQF